MLFVNLRSSSLAQMFYLLVVVVSPLHLSSICQVFKQYYFDGRLILVLIVQGQLSDAKSKLK